ncbi:MAG: hypothetical protein NWF06_10110 [Candidatus Bathyarchaeota archaeon]|nr:hypothetical protein [Candidatus Bathyarchaeum sp.]
MTGTNNKTVSSLNIALISIWAALLLSVSFLIIYPVPGTPVTITFSSVLLSSLTAPLLGPAYGTVAGLIFGWTVPYVNPATSIGILTFLAPTLAALMSGLVLFNRWKEAILILLGQLVIWFAHPFAWYEIMPIITWQYWFVLALIAIPPIRKRIVNTIVTRNQKYLPVALWCLAWIARIGGETITGNNIAVWVLSWGTPDFYPVWAPLTIYYAIADSLNCLIGALIGSAVILALKRNGIRVTALDSLQTKLNAKLKA